MKTPIPVYLLLSKPDNEITIDMIYDEFRTVMSKIKILSECIFVFPNSSSLFEYIRNTNDKDLKTSFRQLYHNNNILTQKSEIFKEHLKIAKVIVIVDYFGMDETVLNILHHSARDDQKIMGYVMNPNINYNDKIFPYSSIVNNIILNNATDDELFIFLAIYHCINDTQLAKLHIDKIRKHLDNFRDVEFITLTNIQELRERINP